MEHHARASGCLEGLLICVLYAGMPLVTKVLVQLGE